MKMYFKRLFILLAIMAYMACGLLAIFGPLGGDWRYFLFAIPIILTIPIQDKMLNCVEILFNNEES